MTVALELRQSYEFVKAMFQNSVFVSVSLNNQTPYIKEEVISHVLSLRILHV